MAKRKLRKGRIAILCIIVILLILSPFIKDYAVGSVKGDTAKITVRAGDGTIAIAQNLKENHIIKHPKLFRLTAKNYDGKWQTCTAEIPKGSGYKDICKLLTEAHSGQIKVTIPEGKQVKQIAQILEENKICSAADFLDACQNHSFDYKFLAGIDHENRLEGYLFPDTYYFAEDTAPDEVITAMLENFQNRVYNNAEYRQQAEKLGYSMNDIIILASMCESEATTEKDRKLVAGVFYNRLQNHDKLQSCVTVEYAMGVKKAVISLADTKFDSPYNTYQNYGLPIGPICCPGLVSIEAALYPADTDYYYFQSDQYGNLYFAKTYEDHANIQTQTHADWDY